MVPLSFGSAGWLKNMILENESFTNVNLKKLGLFYLITMVNDSLTLAVCVVLPRAVNHSLFLYDKICIIYDSLHLS